MRIHDELVLRLARDGYDAVARLRRERGGADWLGAHLMGRQALVVRGASGVRTFYDDHLVSRKGAVPAPVRLLLFGPGAIHGLDEPEHRPRKQLFLHVLGQAEVDRLSHLVSGRLDEAGERWASRGTVALFDELVELYGAAVLDWAGTETYGDEAGQTSRELARIVDGFGIRGTAYPRAALARVRTQRWATRLVREARAGSRRPRPGSALAVLADSQLPALVAATELLNILRPTVAVAYFGAWSAHALSLRPDWRPALATGSPRHLRAFEHEIRRWYPFAPLLAGRLRRSYRWFDRTFGQRAFVVLDIRGTNLDPALWPDPDQFRPERFLDREPTAYDYAPHGGGDVTTGHRCPGEPVTIGLLEATVRTLARLEFTIDVQGREVPQRRIPALPQERMRLLRVRRSQRPGHPQGPR